MSRRILLGVTGSIAAYKAAELVRLFVKNGDSVTVVMTPAATEFVKPLTFQTLSRNQVYVDQFAAPEKWKPEHVALAESADLVVVAPATANTIAKMRYGLADNLLTSILLATRAPVFVAPAMNDGMWENAATQDSRRRQSSGRLNENRPRIRLAQVRRGQASRPRRRGVPGRGWA